MAIAMRPERAAIAVHDPMSSTLGQMIEPFRAQLEPYLFEGITLEKVAAQLVLASRKTPDLVKCEPIVLVDAICRALTTGGLIGQDVFLVPFNNKGVYEPTLMLDYKFKIELVVAAGGARSVDAVPVWEDELSTFSVTYGSEPRIEHRPSMNPPAERKLAGAYAVAHFGRNHTPKILWMTIGEIEAVRANSKQWSPKAGVRVCPPWYAVKTAIHRLVKLLPKKAELRKLFAMVEAEEREEFGDVEEVEARETVRPAHVDADGVDTTYVDDRPKASAAPAVEFPRHIEPADDTAERALDYILPGDSGAWGGFGGKKLREITSVNLLRGVQEWALKQAQLPNGYKQAPELEQAAAIVLDIRVREQPAAGGR